MVDSSAIAWSAKASRTLRPTEKWVVFEAAADEGWPRRVVGEWLDADHQISAEAIRSKAWNALVVADFMNPMEAEWLAEAIESCGVATVVAMAFEYGGMPEVSVIAAQRDAILHYCGQNCWRYVLLTSRDEKFVYLKDEANRFSAITGPADFVASSYRCTWETARKMYFEYWVDAQGRTAEERAFLEAVWSKYAAFHLPMR